MDISPCTSIKVNTNNSDEQWYNQKIEAHDLVNCISWGPSIIATKFDFKKIPETLSPMRFVSGGCDRLVKIWEIKDEEVDSELGLKKFKNTFTFANHSDWIRDVNWLNSPGFLYDTIASCSQVIFYIIRMK